MTATPTPHALSRRSFLAGGAALALAVALSACDERATSPDDAPSVADADQPLAAASGSVAVVYFSVPETTRTEGLTTEEENSVVVIDGQALGNTQYVAQLVAQQTGGELIRLEPATPYTTNHEDLVDLARREQDEDARPELASVPDLSGYDVVFFGYPIWWSDLPQICYTFLEQADLAGKTVVPFNTHGGSGDAGTVADIAATLAGSTVVEDNFVESRNTVAECAPRVSEWLSGLGYSA